MAAFVCLLLFIFLCKCISYKGGVLRKEKDARLSLSWMSLEPSCSLPALVLILVRYLSSHSLTLSRTRPLSLSLFYTNTFNFLWRPNAHANISFLCLPLTLTLTHSFNQKVCFSLSSFHTHILSHDSFLSADHTLTESPSSTLCHVSHYLSLFFFLSHSTDKNTLSLSLTKNVNQGPVRAWFMFCLWSWQAKNKLPILLCRSFKK